MVVTKQESDAEEQRFKVHTWTMIPAWFWILIYGLLGFVALGFALKLPIWATAFVIMAIPLVIFWLRFCSWLMLGANQWVIISDRGMILKTFGGEAKIGWAEVRETGEGQPATPLLTWPFHTFVESVDIRLAMPRTVPGFRFPAFEVLSVEAEDAAGLRAAIDSRLSIAP